MLELKLCVEPMSWKAFSLCSQMWTRTCIVFAMHILMIVWSEITSSMLAPTNVVCNLDVEVLTMIVMNVVIPMALLEAINNSTRANRWKGCDTCTSALNYWCCFGCRWHRWWWADEWLLRTGESVIVLTLEIPTRHSCKCEPNTLLSRDSRTLITQCQLRYMLQ